MLGLENYSEADLVGYILVLFRIMAFVVTWPVFGVNSVPVQAKVLLGITLSFLMFPVVQGQMPQFTIDESLITFAFFEVAIGLILGYVTRLFFFAVSIGGRIISIAMGLGSAQLFNPTLGDQGNAVEQYQVTLATLLFLAINGHYLFLVGLAQSFDALPLGTTHFDIGGFAVIANMGQEILEIGLKLSAPILVAVFLCNLAMGIVGRAVPQINVFVTSIPITIMMGFGILFISLPFFMQDMNSILNVMTERLFQVMKAI